MPTPYDGKIGLIYWTGQSVRENSIEQLARTIHDHMPNARAVFLKVADGHEWQGKYDSKAAMAVSSFGDISKWVNALGQFGLELHAWVVLKGININGEANRVREACNAAGVVSMLLDVESGPGYFSGGAAAARDLIQKIRAGIPPNYHLGLNLDARGAHPKHIHIQEWLPHVQSLHPMVYHRDFGLDTQTAMANAFRALGSFGLPIVPMLQAYGGVSPNEITDAARAAMETHGARGVTIFRIGTMGPNEFAAVRAIAVPAPSAPVVVASVDPDPDPFVNGSALIIRPGDTGYADGVYEPLPPDRDWRTFDDVHGWPVKFKPTSHTQDVYASYVPLLSGAGRYIIEAFIPHQNAEARSALYFVVHYRDGQRIEQKVSIDQSIFFNQWVSLGVYDLDPALEDSGRVNQVDFSIEDPARSIVFSSIRWRPYTEEPRPVPAPAPTPEQPQVVAEGCDPPIGADWERRGAKVWPGEWTDATGFAKWYGDSAGNGAYHTGADLNLNKPRFNLDRGAPVCAIASGVVTWVARWGGVWRNIIIVEHDPLPDGSRIFSRYAHVENMIVGVGDRVRRGQQVCSVGMSGGPGGNYHLHFDISPTDILKKKPGHWPGANRAEVLQHYVDPKAFIASHRPR